MINLAYTVDDKFMPQLAASVCSVCENNRKEKLHFYVIGKQLSDQSKELFTDFVHSYGQATTIIDLGDIRDYIDFPFDTGSWNDVILARLLIDRLLPASVERVLYLDGDTMVRGSLSRLFRAPIDDYVFGMIPEPTVTAERKAVLGMAASDFYYNSGVLLINVKRSREILAGRQILEYFDEMGGNLFAPDQDAINGWGTREREIFTLGYCYNYCNSYQFYPYRTLQKIAKPTPFVSKSLFDKWTKNPVIVHFLGEERPWRKGNCHEYRDEYRKYLSITPWKNTPEETGWERYFTCFYLFNRLIKPFPFLRYKIMTFLIPLMIKYRTKS